MEFDSVEKLLAQVKNIDEKLDDLKKQRDELRSKISDTMNAAGLAQKVVELPTGTFKVTKRHVTTVKYNDELLRERLGSRMKSILDIDYRKIKDHKDEVFDLLGDKLLDVGKISQSRVKAAVASGALSAAEFKGAFTKTESDRLTISQVRGTDDSSPVVDAPY